ncbi:hypothetical protein [Streptomyces sp. NPDC059708]|uniref:hypothetical protein n=1 Tax=Streptomyces sp. NPDC059708 TaxID=3346916 RepID=UPI003677F652
MSTSLLFLAAMWSAGVRPSEADLIAVTVDDAVETGRLPMAVRALPKPPQTLEGLAAELESARAAAVLPRSLDQHVASLTAVRDGVVLNLLGGAR